MSGLPAIGNPSGVPFEPFAAGYRSVWTVHETIVKGYRIELPAGG
jgi:hypothetical protein